MNRSAEVSPGFSHPQYGCPLQPLVNKEMIMIKVTGSDFFFFTAAVRHLKARQRHQTKILCCKLGLSRLLHIATFTVLAER